MTEQEARTAKVTARQVECEVRRHGLDFAEFQAECGVRETYKGAVVLDWLGY